MRRVIARPGPAELDAWCRRHLDSRIADVLFETGHLSSVTGVHLVDGRDVVIKARLPEPRLESCFRIQRFLHAEGYPCPEPLAAPVPLGPLAATAELMVEEGSSLPPGPEVASLFAAPLYELLQLTLRFLESFDLTPVLPWVGWDHGGAVLWPPADDWDDNLNALADETWIDDIATRVRQRLLRDELPRVIGHGDWWQPNLHWKDERLVAVHDWDSLVFLSEAAIAGAAASTYSVIEWGVTTLEENEAFLASYEALRGRHWSQDEREIAWAAGLWQIAFNAKKDVLSGAPQNIEHLRLFGEERLRRAGC